MATVVHIPIGAPDGRRVLGWLAVAAAAAVGIVGLQTATASSEELAGASRRSAGAAATAVAPPPALVTALPEPQPVLTVHEVLAGDTLSGVAAAHGLPVAALLEANGLDADDPLALGQELVIPEGAAAAE